LDSSPAQPTALDIRIAAVTNVITPAPFTNHYGLIMFSIGLPVRIENHSRQTITANVPHIRHLGPLPRTDVGAAVLKLGEPSMWWRRNDVCLVGESADSPKPTVWQPGESHVFNLYLNWPGSNALPAGPLIRSTAPGKYTVCVSLTFETEGRTEYAVSSEMQIQTLAEPPIDERAAGAIAPGPALSKAMEKYRYLVDRFGVEPGWGEAVKGVQVRLHAPRRRWGTNEAPQLLVDIANRGATGFNCPTNCRLWCLEVDDRWYFGTTSMYYVGEHGPNPGQTLTNQPLTLDNVWWGRNVRDKLNLTPGKHNIRVKIFGFLGEARLGAFLQATSNPVEIEITERANEQGAAP
jgi:hypothetical protein